MPLKHTRPVLVTMAYDFSISDAGVSAVITILIATFMINWAAKMVIDRSSLIAAFLTAILGSIGASLVWAGVGGTLGLVLGAFVWALVAAIFYRTAILKGAIIGLVAGVAWFLINLAVEAIMRAIA